MKHFLLLSAICCVCCLGLGTQFRERYPFFISLSNGNYEMYWSFSSADETIQFAVRVKTTGWVGFGISPNGQMPGSDVIIGWVDGNKAYFHVRYIILLS